MVVADSISRVKELVHVPDELTVILLRSNIRKVGLSVQTSHSTEYVLDKEAFDLGKEPVRALILLQDLDSIRKYALEEGQGRTSELRKSQVHLKTVSACQ